MSRPRIGFVGTGWIGRHRMAAMIATGAVEAAWIVEPDDVCAAEALAIAPGAERLESLDNLLRQRPDGVVIATPSALHADQSIRALEAGAHVFCQKPLGRNADEVAAVLAAASRSGRSLAVDFSYRHSAAFRAIKALVDDGALGDLFAVEAVFHNGYGPDKPWFHDPALSGGGCLIDLGVHLADMIGQLIGERVLTGVDARLLRGGRPVMPGQVEDYASARLNFDGGVACDLHCSWNAPIGADCAIGLRLFGTHGGAHLANIDGSFYDLAAWHDEGTRSRMIASPPDGWGGRAAARWAETLGSALPDPAIAFSARICDAIYGAGLGGAPSDRTKSPATSVKMP